MDRVSGGGIPAYRRVVSGDFEFTHNFVERRNVGHIARLFAGCMIALMVLLLTPSLAMAQPEIEVQGNSTIINTPDTTPSIADGTDAGSVGVGSSKTLNYFILNNGTTNLTLTNPVVSGTNAGDFTVIQNPVSSVPAGNQTDFALSFSPSATGLRTATVTFTNNDGDENPFTFDVQGTGTATPDSFTIVSGNNQSAALNAAFAAPLVVRVLDGSSNPISGVTINFTPPDQGGGAVPGATLSQITLVTDGNGDAAITATANNLAGAYQVTATLPGFNQVSFDLTNGAGDVTAPRIAAITRANPTTQNTNADSLTWRYTFDEPVQNVDLTDFLASGPGGASFTVNAITSTVYDVTISGGDLAGLNATVSVSLAVGHNIGDLATPPNALTNTTPIGTNDDDFIVSNIGPEMYVEEMSANLEIADGRRGASLARGTLTLAVPPGGSQTFTYEIHNTGTSPLNLIGATPVTVTHYPAGTPSGINPRSTVDFNVTQPMQSTIPAGDFTTFTVTFAPLQAGYQYALVNIANDDADENPYDFQIIGIGQGVAINVRGNDTDIVDGDTTPDAADHTDFGDVNVASGDITRIFSVENTGNDWLVFNSTTISGPDAGDFTITNPLPAQRPAQNSAPLHIKFDPSAPGVRNATLTINSNATDEPAYSFALQGTGLNAAPEINVKQGATNIPDDPANDPAALSATDMSAGVGQSTTKTYTIENTGAGLLTLGANAVSITGTDTSKFSVPLQPASTLAAGATTTFQIRFSPDALRLFGPANIIIANDDADENPYNFRIQGTGSSVVVTSPEINVTGNAIGIVDGDTTPDAADHTDFGPADVTTGLISRTFTIQNTGSAVLTLGANATSLSGSGAGDFSIVSQPSATIVPGGNSTVVVQFDPSIAGVRSAILTIANDDADESPYNFNIQGTGTSAVSDITIALNVDGPDTRLNFSSATSALNFSVISAGGTAQTNIPNIPVGAHVVTVADLTAMGYAITAIMCSDTDSTTDLTTRTATIVVGPAESVTCTFTLKETRSITSQIIVDYLSTRNNFILNNQADRTRRFSRLKDAGIFQDSTGSTDTPLGFTAQLPSPVAVSVSDKLLSYAGSARETLGFFENRSGNSQLPDIGNWDIWSEGNFSLFNDNTSQSGNFGVVHLGADYLVSANVLLGARVQIDWIDQAFATTNGKVDGTGFMAGPYATIALGDNLFFDISGAWGLSQNTISPFGTYTDHFSTSRWMIDGSLAGQYVLDNWTVRPTLAFAYIDDYQNPYTDSLNVPIPGQRVAQGEVSFAPHVSYDFMLEDGSVLTPWLEVKGHYAFQTAGKPSTGSYGDAMNAFSASIGGGIDFNLTSGASFALSAQYGGIGTNATRYGLDFGVSVPLN